MRQLVNQRLHGLRGSDIGSNRYLLGSEIAGPIFGTAPVTDHFVTDRCRVTCKRIPDALGAAPSKSLGRTASRSGSSSPSVCEISKTCTTRNPRICCNVFSSASSVSILVLSYTGEDRDSLFALLDETAKLLPSIEAGDHWRVGSLAEDHEVVVKAVAVEL